MKEKKCLRCGKCCHDHTGNACPFLRQVPGRFVYDSILPLMRCGQWKKRNKALHDGKRIIINGHACLTRMEDPRSFDGCPFNKEG